MAAVTKLGTCYIFGLSNVVNVYSFECRFVNCVSRVNNTLALGDVCGRPIICLRAWISILSSMFRSVLLRVHVSALLSNSGMISASWSRNMAVSPILCMTLFLQHVVIALSFPCLSFRFSSFFPFLFMTSPRYL